MEQSQRRASELTVEVQSKESEIKLLKEQIERQKKNLVAVEERWARQAHDISGQQKTARYELEQVLRFSVTWFYNS